MPKKSNKRKNVKRKTRKTRKQKPIIMIGCSKKGKKSCKNTLGNKLCSNCGPNCHCGPNCNCKHPCPGTCYLNRRRQKGGTGCGSCGCPLAPLSWNKMISYANQSGGCDCGSSHQSGGASVPSPFVGSPWSVNLPGAKGIDGVSNYYKPFNSDANPQLQMTMNDSGYNTKNSTVGGYKKKSRGGGLVPQDLVNLGRDINYNFKSAYNTLNGFPAPVDPAPYKGQLTGTLSKGSFI